MRRIHAACSWLYLSSSHFHSISDTSCVLFSSNHAIASYQPIDRPARFCAQLVDMPNTKKSDLRRARSGMLNLCPTSTGSATAIVEIYPELKGKLNGLAIRVPLLNASLTDCVFEVEKPTTKEEVNAALKAASESGPLKGILGYEEKPLVSTDYTNDTRSSIIDALSTQVIDGTLVKIYAWYDNEAGYSKRMAELCNIVANRYIAGEEESFKYE